MRCDLHVHSWHSGMADLPLLRHVGRECYSDPFAVYERALARGMDLVTLTDHDSIEGGLRLAHLPNTFLSEEVTVRLEGGRQLHVNVFDVDECQHAAIQRRAADPEVLFAYLAEQRIPASVNHLFSALTGEREVADLLLPLGRLPLAEALNGAMPRVHNERAELVGRAAGMAAIGGSDAHSLSHVARAYTVVPGARSKREFLDGLRRGLSIPAGCSGSYARLTAEVARIFAAGYAETAAQMARRSAPGLRVAASALLLPFLPLIPLFTFAIHVHEVVFASRLFRALGSAPLLPPAHGGPPLEEAA